MAEISNNNKKFTSASAIKILILILIIGGAIFFIRPNVKAPAPQGNDSQTNNPIPTPTQSQTPSSQNSSQTTSLSNSSDPDLSFLKTPIGVTITKFAQKLGAPRVILFAPNGTMLVSIPSDGKIIALPDKNKDGRADETITVISNLNRPHGLEMTCENNNCLLFIAETNKVMSYEYDIAKDEITNKSEEKKLLTFQMVELTIVDHSK